MGHGPRLSENHVPKAVGHAWLRSDGRGKERSGAEVGSRLTEGAMSKAISI